MARVEQIYCTHCTPETSVTGRFTGFAARAGSLDPERLRAAYDAAFGAASVYQLPDGTPLEDALRATADTAPVRLLFLPSTGTPPFQAVGQVCYRPADAADPVGVGSHFAHFVFIPAVDGVGWTTLDALRLWGATGWVRSDTPDIPWLLPPLGRLDELLGGGEPGVGEETFHSFLTAPPSGPFHDPSGVIPGRWRSSTCEDRRGLFEEVLDAYLAADLRRPGALVLLAEPGLAALLFFGLARTAPASVCGRAVSFSTYEGGRPLTALAAALPGGPGRPGAEPPACRGTGYVSDTFARERRTAGGAAPGAYARCVARILTVGGGWGELDRMLAGFEAAGPRGPAELEGLARAHEALGAWSDRDTAPLPLPASPAGSAADRYAATALRARVDACAGDTPALLALAASPHAAALLCLLSRADADPGLVPALDVITSGLTPPALAALLGSVAAPRRVRVLALLGHLARYSRWPGALEAAIYRAVAGDASALEPAVAEVLPDVLGRLPAVSIRPLYLAAPEAARVGFLAAVAAKLSHQPEARTALRGVTDALGDDEFCRFVAEGAGGVVGLFRHDPAPLHDRADALLRGLTDRPRLFHVRLAALAKLAALLRADQAARVRGWEGVKDAVGRAPAAAPRRAVGLTSLFGKRPDGPDPLAGLAAALAAALPGVNDPARRRDLLLALIDKGALPGGRLTPGAREAVARAALGPRAP